MDKQNLDKLNNIEPDESNVIDEPLSPLLATHEENDVEISLQENIGEESAGFKFENNDVDELYSKAVDLVISQQKVSTSYIQRYLQIGYNRAARIVEKMEEDEIISEANNSGKRQVLKKR